MNSPNSENDLPFQFSPLMGKIGKVTKIFHFPVAEINELKR